MLPLEGITIVDLTQAEAGPRGTTLLSDMGANVIKIEPPTGEYTRPVTRKWDAGTGCNAYFLSHNRNKRAMAFDYRTGKGAEIMNRLLKKADVFVESYSPGTAERHGFGYENLCKINPKIIYASINGFGKLGPMNMRRGYDIVTQAASGMLHQNGLPAESECALPTGIIDQCAGVSLAYGITVALFHRERTGEGQQLDVSLLQTAYYMLSVEICSYLLKGIHPTKSGRGHSMAEGLYMTFPCKDRWIAFGGVRNEPWEAMCKAMGLDTLINDPRFVTTDDRAAHRDELVPLLDEAFRKKTAAEWTSILENVGAIVFPVLSIGESLSDPRISQQIAANEMIVDVPAANGKTAKVIGPLVKLSKTPAKVNRGDFLVGQDNFEIISELGYSPEEIAQMAQEGII